MKNLQYFSTMARGTHTEAEDFRIMDRDTQTKFWMLQDHGQRHFHKHKDRLVWMFQNHGQRRGKVNFILWSKSFQFYVSTFCMYCSHKVHTASCSIFYNSDTLCLGPLPCDLPLHLLLSVNKMSSACTLSNSVDVTSSAAHRIVCQEGGKRRFAKCEGTSWYFWHTLSGILCIGM